LFLWIFNLNFGIGLFNLLPLKPFDGGVIFEELVGKIASKRVTRYATYTISLFCLSLIVINIGYGLLNAFI
jgi:membrane-associated protease RseP (regulator of RpoE activity)